MPHIVMTRILKLFFAQNPFMDQSQITSQQDSITHINYEPNPVPLATLTKKEVRNFFSCIWNEYYSDSYLLQ